MLMYLANEAVNRGLTSRMGLCLINCLISQSQVEFLSDKQTVWAGRDLLTFQVNSSVTLGT
jgi:hypothetical protein